jgi:hypothetical protein
MDKVFIFMVIFSIFCSIPQFVNEDMIDERFSNKLIQGFLKTILYILLPLFAVIGGLFVWYFWVAGTDWDASLLLVIMMIPLLIVFFLWVYFQTKK